MTIQNKLRRTRQRERRIRIWSSFVAGAPSFPLLRCSGGGLGWGHVSDPHQRRSHACLPNLAILVLALSTTALSLVGCKRETNAFAPPPPPAVTVAHPIQRPVTRYLESTGTTEAFESVELRARVPGFLAEIDFKPGATVKKNDLLFVIDRRTYKAAVDRAQAQVLADEASYKAAVSDAKIYEELAAQRAGSEIDKITKIGKRDSAKAQVEASKATLENAKLDLEFCEVRAPIDGRITKNLVDIGNLVGAANQPTVLATMVSSRPIYVSIDASERDLMMARSERIRRSPDAKPGEISPGKWRPVDLAPGDESDFAVHGRIDYVDPALNAQTGTIRVRCRFENEDELLLPGMFVRLRVFLDTVPSMVAPDIALLSDQSGRYALVVNDKNAVEVRRVKIGALDGSMRVVLEGLSASDRIVVNGLQRARPGATVVPTLTEIQSGQATTSAANPAASGPAKLE
ncbi:MAG: efflux transporter periplasmic adaptor subunit [Phycisphaerales bacterium]|nr:efflux transporter periplasmic adaptor subunit [Phycisphaerales bacterium]